MPGNKIKGDGNRHRLHLASDTGSDYVHFVCPKCSHRNKICMYEAESYIPVDKNVIPFKCKMCRVMVEVEPPAKPMTQESLIVSPTQFGKEMSERRRELSVNRTKLGRPNT